MPKRRVVVTGLGVVSSNGIGKDQFWEANIQGRSGIENIKNLPPSKIKKIKNTIRGVSSKDISLFAQYDGENSSSEMDEIAAYVNNQLEIPYTEDKRKFASYMSREERKLEIKVSASIGNDVGRVIAKIAFNKILRHVR